MRSPTASSISHYKVRAVKRLDYLTACQTVFSELLFIVFIVFIDEKIKNLTRWH